MLGAPPACPEHCCHALHSTTHNPTGYRATAGPECKRARQCAPGCVKQAGTASAPSNASSSTRSSGGSARARARAAASATHAAPSAQCSRRLRLRARRAAAEPATQPSMLHVSWRLCAPRGATRAGQRRARPVRLITAPVLSSPHRRPAELAQHALRFKRGRRGAECDGASARTASIVLRARGPVPGQTGPCSASPDRRQQGRRSRRTSSALRLPVRVSEQAGARRLVGRPIAVAAASSTAASSSTCARILGRLRGFTRFRKGCKHRTEQPVRALQGRRVAAGCLGRVQPPALKTVHSTAR